MILYTFKKSIAKNGKQKNIYYPLFGPTFLYYVIKSGFSLASHTFE